MTSPFLWFSRIRHRRGYGVHSPWAFQLITQVIYEPGEFYAYEWLDLQFRHLVRWFRLLPLRRARLLFRLANHWQPKTICALGADAAALSYLHQGCLGARLTTEPDGAQLVYLREPHAQALERLAKGGLLIVDCLPQNKPFWRQIMEHPRTSVTFNLYHLGLAIVEAPLQRQDYTVNW